jgi:hypothetical protein
MFKENLGDLMEEFFYGGAFNCVNDNAKVDFENAQIMQCIFCYKNPITTTNLRTQVKKRLIFYYKTNGITTLQKHVDVDHIVIAKRIEKEVNSLLKEIEEKKLVIFF